jgi:hypothetical protein
VHLKRALLRYPTPSKGVYDLWDRMEVKSNEIIVETYQNLIESMSRRVQAVIEANGGYTRH